MYVELDLNVGQVEVYILTCVVQSFTIIISEVVTNLVTWLSELRF